MLCVWAGHMGTGEGRAGVGERPRLSLPGTLGRPSPSSPVPSWTKDILGQLNFGKEGS